MSNPHPWFSSTQLEPLSAAGHRRRDTMLGELTGALRRRRRARSALRGTATAALGVAVVCWAVLAWPRPDAAPSAPPGASPATRQMAHADFATVPARFDLRARWAPASAPLVQRVGDRELPALLIEAGHPAGILKVAGHVAPVVPFEDAPASDE